MGDMTSAQSTKPAKEVTDGAGNVFEKLVHSVKSGKEDNCVRTFGESLVTLLARGNFRKVSHSESGSMQVPEVMVEMISYLIEEGMDEQGLFRVSAEMHKIREVKEAFDDPTSAVVDLSHFDGGVIAAVSGALKAFLGELPEPLIPLYMNDLFLECQPTSSEKNNNADKDIHTNNLKLADTVKRLPALNLGVLKYLCSFLVMLAKHKEKTKMNAGSLGIIFGPVLFRLPSEDCVDVIKKQACCNALTRRFILFFEDIFKCQPIELVSSRRTIKGPMKPFIRYPAITFDATKRRGFCLDDDDQEEEEQKEDSQAVEPTTVTDGIEVSSPNRAIAKRKRAKPEKQTATISHEGETAV